MPGSLTAVDLVCPGALAVRMLAPREEAGSRVEGRKGEERAGLSAQAAESLGGAGQGRIP